MKTPSGDTIEFDAKTRDRIRTMWNTADDGEIITTRWIITKLEYESVDEDPRYPMRKDRSYRKQHFDYLNHWPLHKKIRDLEDELKKYASGEIRGLGCHCE